MHCNYAGRTSLDEFGGNPIFSLFPKTKKGDEMRYEALISAILVLTTISSSVYAQSIFGGEPVSYTFPRCAWLTVNITDAVLTQWNAAPNCTEQSAGNFYCTCSDNYTLILTPKPNAMGTFTIFITNYITQSTETQSVLVSSGRGEIPTVLAPTNQTTTTTIPQITPENTMIKTVTLPASNSSTNVPATNPANPISGITGLFALPTFQYSFAIIATLIVLSVLWYLIRRRKKANSNQTPATLWYFIRRKKANSDQTSGIQ
jgi:hypothetical protein